MKNKRWVSLMLALILAVSGLSGCSLVERITGRSSEEKKEDTTGESANYASDSAILSVGKERISQSEAVIYWLMLKDRYETGFGPSVWDLQTGEGRTFREDATMQMLEEIVQVHVMCMQAEDLGITVDEESEKELQASVTDYLANLSAEEKARYSLDDEEVYKVYHDCLLAETVFETVTGNVSISVPDSQIRQCRVLAMTYPTGEADPNGKLRKLLAAAKEITDEEERKLYFTGNSLDEQVEYVVGADSMEVDETLVLEALKLKTGEFSEIFTTAEGTTFLYCVNESDEEAIRLKKQQMILDSQREAFAEQYAAWRDDVSVKMYEDEIEAFLEKIAEKEG
ncbi:MAG: hypothetical protein IJ744_04085 [Lachnospiraceae bacterium]|nr:hypothetical protein [Lachnospiraceae bacterium]